MGSFSSWHIVCAIKMVVNSAHVLSAFLVLGMQSWRLPVFMTGSEIISKLQFFSLIVSAKQKQTQKEILGKIISFQDILLSLRIDSTLVTIMDAPNANAVP